MLQLLFVWRDIDSICKVITFRDHFDLLWAVEDNVGPGQTQERLHVSFQKLLAEVMIIGRVEGLCSHGNDIVHTGGINQRNHVGYASGWPSATGESQWKVEFRCSTCAEDHV